MTQDSENFKAEELAKKVILGQHLTVEDKKLLDSSETLMTAYLEAVFPGSELRKKYGNSNGDSNHMTEEERQRAMAALQRGKAVLRRELPWAFANSKKS